MAIIVSLTAILKEKKGKRIYNKKSINILMSTNNLRNKTRPN